MFRSVENGRAVPPPALEQPLAGGGGGDGGVSHVWHDLHLLPARTSLTSGESVDVPRICTRAGVTPALGSSPVKCPVDGGGEERMSVSLRGLGQTSFSNQE